MPGQDWGPEKGEREMNEERLTAIENGVPNDIDIRDLIAAARQRNELEAERDALKEELAECFADYNGAMDERRELGKDARAAYEKAMERKQQIDTLRANNAALREAVKTAIHGLPELLERNALIDEENMIGKLQEVLASTPADSLTLGDAFRERELQLKDHRNAVLEEVDKRILTCCSVCSDGIVNGQDCPSCTVLRLTVRAMRTTNDTD